MTFPSRTFLSRFVFALSVTILTACGGGSSSTAPADQSGSAQVTALKQTDTVVGTGAQAATGKVVTVQYTGWLYDSKAANFKGTQIDSSVARGTPFVLLLGATQTQYVAGWDQGIPGMKVGGKRTLIIPSALAFGSAGVANIVPADAAVVYDIELISIDASGSDAVTALVKTDTVVGTGVTADNGKTITVQYTGWLYDVNAVNFKGTKFDSSVDRATTFSFTLGTGAVIAGWDQGVLGMKVGGKRTLIIPSSLGYRQTGNGSIPPNAALVFDVEVVGVQ